MKCPREQHLGHWLLIVCAILIPLQIYSAAADPAELQRLLAGRDAVIALIVLLSVAALGVVICLRSLYSFWWSDRQRSFGERFFWAVALLNLPYGMLLYYFVVYRPRASRG